MEVLVWKCLHCEAPSYLVELCSGGFDRRLSTPALCFVRLSRVGIAGGAGVEPPSSCLQTLIFVKIRFKFQSLSKISNISISDPPPVLLGQFPHCGYLMVPRTRTSLGQWSFAVFRPLTWNKLPPPVQSTNMTLQTFWHKLKDVPVPAVTVVILRQHWPALLWLLQWARRRI